MEIYEADSETVYVYRRTYKGNALYIFGNFTSEEQTVKEMILPQRAERVLGNYQEHSCGMLKAYEVIVYSASIN